MSTCKIIIDTDPGVDDAAAILMALASPELQVLGLTVVAGNVALSDALRNACAIAGLANGRKPPVLAGASAPLIREQVFGKYSHIGVFPAEHVPSVLVAPEAEHAVAFMARSARTAYGRGEKITLCAIGPMTNIALALLQHPDMALGIERIVCMGGAFTALGHRTPWAEFNIYADPHAAEIVFNAGIPLTLFPLDVTFQTLFTQQHFDRFSAGGVAGAALRALFMAHDRSDETRFGRPGGPIHDAAPIAWLLRPELFTHRPAHIGVQVSGMTAGHTYADFYNKTGKQPNADIVTGVDQEGFSELLIESIARLGAVAHDKRTQGGSYP